MLQMENFSFNVNFSQAVFLDTFFMTKKYHKKSRKMQCFHGAISSQRLVLLIVAFALMNTCESGYYSMLSSLLVSSSNFFCLSRNSVFSGISKFCPVSRLKISFAISNTSPPISSALINAALFLSKKPF